MGVTIGISKRSDFTLDNAGYRLLLEIAYPSARDEDDRRILNGAMWTHFLDLTHLDRVQGRRIAWLLSAAAQARVEDWQAGRAEPGSASAEAYRALTSLLGKAFGEEPVVVTVERPAELSELAAEPGGRAAKAIGQPSAPATGHAAEPLGPAIESAMDHAAEPAPADQAADRTGDAIDPVDAALAHGQPV